MSETQQSRWSGFGVGALFFILCMALTSVSLITNATSLTVPSAVAEVHPLSLIVKEDEDPLKKLDGSRFMCQSATALITCYSPRQIRTAYNVTPLLQQGITGVGSTIVIIDAYQSPTIRQDLHLFDRIFGLPDPVLTILAPDGLTPFNPLSATQLVWASEITLDVEWAHAVAPGAKLKLVLARGANVRDILSATRFAIDSNQGDIISQSFASGETCSAASLSIQHQIFQNATARGITLLAASGDTGAAQPGQTLPTRCGDNLPYFLSTATPASDPLVTSVGGTHLNIDANSGRYISETTWNDSYGASGGGYSSILRRPSYQDGVVKNKQRGVPDVAFDADPNGGVLIICSSCTASAKPIAFCTGGTSAGSPQWAGVVALANQVAGKRLGFINAAIYRIGQGPFYHTAFHDIVSGNNTFTKVLANGTTITIQGYIAAPDWDATTGFGTPIVTGLVPLLIANKYVGDGSAL